jgi:hypothetical protein
MVKVAWIAMAWSELTQFLPWLSLLKTVLGKGVYKWENVVGMNSRCCLNDV